MNPIDANQLNVVMIGIFVQPTYFEGIYIAVCVCACMCTCVFVSMYVYVCMRVMAVMVSRHETSYIS